MARNVFQNHNGVINDESCRDGERHEAQVIETVVAEIHDTKGADQGNRHHDAGNERCTAILEEEVNRENDQRHGEDERSLDFLQRRQNRRCPVHDRLHMNACRYRCFKLRQDFFHMRHRLDDVGARLPIKNEHHRTLTVSQADVPDILNGIGNGCDVFEPHRCAITPDNDNGFVIGGRLGLIVGLQNPAPVRGFQAALGQIHVGLEYGIADIFAADAHRLNDRRNHRDPDGRLRAAANRDLSNPVHLGEFLRQNRVRRIEYLINAQGVRCQCQHHDRRIRRIHLTVSGIRRETGWQKRTGSHNRCLHITGGAIDIAIELELQGDIGRPLRTDRSHLRHAGDPAQRSLERRRDARRHRFRACAGQGCSDANRRKVDLWQRRDR